jgi:hypothetical protein
MICATCVGGRTRIFIGCGQAGDLRTLGADLLRAVINDWPAKAAESLP